MAKPYEYEDEALCPKRVRIVFGVIAWIMGIAALIATWLKLFCADGEAPWNLDAPEEFDDGDKDDITEEEEALDDEDGLW